MGVNLVYVSALSTAASFVGLQWWVFTLLDGIKADGLIEGGQIHPGNARRALDLVLASNVTVALLVNLVLNVFACVALCLKTILFVHLYPSEARKVLERLFNYVVYKGIFLPLVVPPSTFQIVLWSSWLIILSFLKIFQSLARYRLERLNASPTTTPSKYLCVFSILLLVLVADIIWIRLCLTMSRSFTSNLFLLLFFEPFSIAFETLQAIMVHGFQFSEIWQRHSVDCGDDFLGSLTLSKSSSGSLSEWKGILIQDGGFLLDILSLSMALGHHLIIWWLHGVTFHVVDTVLFLNFRGLVGDIVKRTRGYVKLKRALNSLDSAVPDATFEELSAFDDECAICRGPMARAKKLACNHLFHLACLRSWLDQGLSDQYSCPTCRRPLFLRNSRGSTSTTARQGSNNNQLIQQNLGLDEQRILGNGVPVGIFPNQPVNPSDALWRGVGFDSSWVPPWPSPVRDGAGPSGSTRSAGIGGVQLMMRQLTSVRENYAQGSIDNRPTMYNVWPSNQASSSSTHPSSSSLRFNRNTRPAVNGNNIQDMVDRVREVLPHIPDEIIIEDLRRTNNINITVNNLLLVQ